MTESQKKEIIRMRAEGASFSKIADATGISRNTVKSFCRRRNITVRELKSDGGLFCKQCGKTIHIVSGRKIPKFCSDKCRTQWWNSHQEEINRKAVYTFVCAKCGKSFTSYGNKDRKYCSHSCYISARFGGSIHE